MPTRTRNSVASKSNVRSNKVASKTVNSRKAPSRAKSAVPAISTRKLATAGRKLVTGARRAVTGMRTRSAA